MVDGWARTISTRYKLPIASIDNFEADKALFIQEVAGLIVNTSIELSRTLGTPTPKENAAQHRTRMRKMQRSKSVIERLAYWFHVQSKLSS